MAARSANHLTKKRLKQNGGRIICCLAVSGVFNKSRKSPASIAKSNKQWVGTCLYQEGYKPLLINCEAVI